MGIIMLLALIIIALVVFIFLVFVFVLLPLLYGAPYETSTDIIVNKIIKLSNAKKGEKVVDLGSGNGKIVIEFAKRGIEAHGFEINPFLVLWSRYKIKRFGLEKKAFVHWKNFWNSWLGDFDIVVVFQVGYLMGALERKLEKELSKGARIISNRWRFPLWAIKERYETDTGVFLYRADEFVKR